jgi:hypothetical protein
VLFLFFLILFVVFGLPWRPTVGGHFWPFTQVLHRICQFATRKMKPRAAEAAVPAPKESVIRKVQAPRLPLQLYFSETLQPASQRSGFQIGSSCFDWLESFP